MSTTHWPAPDEIVESESEDEVDIAQPQQELAVQASIDAVYKRYIQTKPDGKLTKEGIRQVFEKLDAEHIAVAKRRRVKVPQGKATNGVSEVYSPPRTTEVAESTGLRKGWALDLAVRQDDVTSWELFTQETQARALKLQQEHAPELLIASPMRAAFSTLQTRITTP